MADSTKLTKKMGDGEVAAPLPSVDPPQRLKTPSQQTDPNAQGHSKTIPWPEDKESTGPKPFKNLH